MEGGGGKNWMWKAPEKIGVIVIKTGFDDSIRCQCQSFKFIGARLNFKGYLICHVKKTLQSIIVVVE